MFKCKQLRRGSFIFLALAAVVVAEDFATERERGRQMLTDLASKPLTPQTIQAEVRTADQVVGYFQVKLEDEGENAIRGTVETTLDFMDSRISGVVSVAADRSLKPARIEFSRFVDQPDTPRLVERGVCEVKGGKIILTESRGGKNESSEKPNPEAPFFTGVDLLVARAELGKVEEAFALTELDPTTGESRLLVFQPAKEGDFRVLNVLVDGKKPEATYRFSSDGTLLSWLEPGAPVTLHVVDQARGEALMKQYGPPQGNP